MEEVLEEDLVWPMPINQPIQPEAGTREVLTTVTVARGIGAADDEADVRHLASINLSKRYLFMK
jgi:hypothetical protein